MTTDSKAAPSDAGKRDTAIELVSFYRKAVVEALGGGAEEVATMHAEQRRLVNALTAPGAAIAAREQEAIDRAAWAKLAAKAHGWADDSTPPMVDGRFETGWHESEFQTFMQGVRHGRS
ncbi:hypothetical protein J2X90_000741 [Variovorax paradoxus]|uniref:hypothetical protein n=1 Tax=Variovorax paradoxus TaxID=34073 RepID=UPI002784E8F6|nr:hypothetical protein [Variovorax paradoxus]MDQ0022955.1 hypothetical protein [Variovorax paradoxus]